MSGKSPLELLNIVPMLPEHREELAADTLDLLRRGCINRTAFILTLVPEGNPPADKAKVLGERFEQFRAALGKTDMPVGILIQATIGHGWVPNTPSEFQRIVLPDGERPYMFCPLDEAFRACIGDAVRRLAALRPDFLMVDDDFRLLTGRDGCFCPLHLARFNREQGTAYDRETLAAALGKDAALAAKYDALLKQSLIELAGVIRRAVDETDPEMPCSFCACSRDMRHAPAIARILAAPGEPLTIRINNARYLNESLRTVPEWLMFTARQIAACPPGSRLLAEPDTFPHNRYSTSAAMMHLQLTCSILEGCRGGKFWLSRSGCWEPESGRLYRDTLARNVRFYQALAELPVEWTGAATVLPETPPLNFPLASRSDSNRTWSTQVLGKMGIPFHFTTSPGGIVTLAGSDCDALSDAQLNELFSRHNCLLDGPAAVAACERGFGPAIGVAAEAWNGKPVTFELTRDGNRIPAAATNDREARFAKLTPLPGTEELSKFYHTPSGVSPEKEYMMPGATFRRIPGGGRIAVIASPVTQYGFAAFSMLNQSRKAQLLEIFERFGGLPWHFPGDDEILLKTGKAEGYEIALLIDLSLDDVPEVRLAGPAEKAASVETLLPDGKWEPAQFVRDGGELRISRALRPLRPLVLRIKLNQ